MDKREKLFFVILTALLWTFFLTILVLRIAPDIEAHVGAIRSVFLREGKVPIHFLYFLTVYLLALGQIHPYVLAVSSALVLAISVSAKYGLSLRYARTYLQDQRDAMWIRSLPLLLLALIFALNFPSTRNYLSGQATPNLWHNSTVVFLMPFALALFWRSYRFLQGGKLRLIPELSLWVALNIFAKPSFFMCFALVFPIMSLVRFRLKSTFFLSLIPVTLGALLMLGEYWLIYQWYPPSMADTETSGIAIQPFMVWRTVSDHIGLSLLLSLPFTWGLIALEPKLLRESRLLQYALTLFAAAILIASLLVETGPRAWDGNFMWQLTVCSYLLLWVSLLEFLKITLFPLKRIKDYVLASLFGLQVLSGLVYLVRYFITGSFN